MTYFEGQVVRGIKSGKLMKIDRVLPDKVRIVAVTDGEHPQGVWISLKRLTKAFETVSPANPTSHQ
jgi:predicted RNase H-like nuclease (RuvC/YqgF family)